MGLTIKEALKFGGLFGASVVAGKEGLDTPIESVSVLEVAEHNISRWVLKNQLYITSFYAIWDNVAQQKEVIETLIDCECCGLVLCYVGTWIRQIDLGIIQLCDEAGFPLIQARTDVSYIEIMNPIITLLYEENTRAMVTNDYSMVRNDFLNLVVNEENIDVVFQQMNRRLKKKVSYYDTYGKVIYSDRDLAAKQAEEEYLKDNFNHILFECSRDGYTVQDIQGRKNAVVLIRSQKNLFGLFFLDYDGDFEENIKNGLINSMVVSGTLILQKRSKVSHFREKVMEEYVTDLLVWNFPSNAKALERGLELGLTVLDKNQIIVVNINSIQSVTDSKVQQEMQRYIRHVLLSQVKQLLNLYDPKSWLVFRSDTILLFMNNQNGSVHLENLGEKLLRIFDGKFDLSVSVGVSNAFASMTDIPSAYTQAFQAATVGRDHYGENKVVFYDAVYFFQKLRQMGKQPEIVEMCHKLLGPVLRYDEEHKTQLTDTLRCLLVNNENVKKTAEQLFIHKNTVLQRKNKLTELFGYSPFDMPYRLNFLMIFDIMEKK